MARIRSIPRNIMNRAWDIAKNAMNAHNSNPEKIAQHGGSASIMEFFTEALKIAWKEQKVGQQIYRKVSHIPRKIMPRIQKAVQHATRQFSVNMSEQERNFQVAIIALSARIGNNKVSKNMISELRQVAYATN